MSGYVITIGLWLIPVLGVAAYLITRAGLAHSRSLLIFDSVVLTLLAILCVGFWWREITGHISKDIWLDEYGFMLILVPMWTSIISVPLLVIAAVIRGVIFSTAQGDGTRAI